MSQDLIQYIALHGARCPHCGRHMRRTETGDCPHCGTPIHLLVVYRERDPVTPWSLTAASLAFAGSYGVYQWIKLLTGGLLDADDATWPRVLGTVVAMTAVFAATLVLAAHRTLINRTTLLMQWGITLIAIAIAVAVPALCQAH